MPNRQRLVYYLQFHDSEADDRHGSNSDYADEYGVWLDEQGAQDEADRRNAALREKAAGWEQQRFEQASRAYERAQREYAALAAAGLRDEPFTTPPPTPPAAPIRLRDYWLIDSYVLNDAPDTGR